MILSLLHTEEKVSAHSGNCSKFPQSGSSYAVWIANSTSGAMSVEAHCWQVHIHTDLSTHVNTHMNIHAYTNTHVDMFSHMNTHVSMCIHEHM